MLSIKMVLITEHRKILYQHYLLALASEYRSGTFSTYMIIALHVFEILALLLLHLSLFGFSSFSHSFKIGKNFTYCFFPISLTFCVSSEN